MLDIAKLDWIVPTALTDAQWRLDANGIIKTAQEISQAVNVWYQENQWIFAILYFLLLVIPIGIALRMVIVDAQMKKRLARIQANTGEKP